jgi:hypothetical protein
MEYQIQLPRLPAHIIKYIVSFRKEDTEYVLNVFKAFVFGIENDDEYTREYKEYVQRHIAIIAFDLVDACYNLTEEKEFALSTHEIMCVYEFMCSDHYTQISEGLNNYLCGRKEETVEEFLDCVHLLEMTRLVDDEEISYGMPNLNIEQIKYMRLLEMALITKSVDLMKFVRKHIYSPIMAFYLYLKHNHKLHNHKLQYNNVPSSLAADDWLIMLLLEDNYRKEFLCLALRGLFSHYCWSSNSENNVVYSNLEVVKKIVPEYVKPTDYIPASLNWIDTDADYPPRIVTPLEHWENFSNDMIIDRVGYGKHTIVIPKDELIRDYLISVS